MHAALETAIREQLAANRTRPGAAPEAVEIPAIPAGRYTDETMFEAERDQLFRNTWLYALHESQIPNPGDYATFERSGAPLLIVRGRDNRLRAFYNACRHRGAPVARDQCGSARRLTCQYHSWSYDLTGKLKAVPDAREFIGLDVDNLGLVPAQLQTWQHFAFVNEDPDAAPLDEFLGPMADQMAEIDGSSLRHIGHQRHPIEANWKIVVDAFLEVYHVRTVHPDNAALLYDDQTTVVAMLPNGHSRLSVGIRPELLGVMDPSPVADNPSVGQLWRETSTSFGWFPNVVAALDTGAFPLLCIWPVDRTTTELELQWFAPDWGDGPMPEEHGLRMTLFETVMAQDTANLGAIQRSVESRGARPLRIGWHERLIHHFHRAVDLAIGEARLPAPLAVSDVLDRFVER